MTSSFQQNFPLDLVTALLAAKAWIVRDYDTASKKNRRLLPFKGCSQENAVGRKAGKAGSMGWHFGSVTLQHPFPCVPDQQGDFNFPHLSQTIIRSN